MVVGYACRIMRVQMQPTDCGSSPTSGGSREDASEDTQSGSRGRKGRGKHVMSESEINRRVRRAAAAARHGHPEPKHNRIPAGQQGLGDSAGARLQEALPVAGVSCASDLDCYVCTILLRFVLCLLSGVASLTVFCCVVCFATFLGFLKGQTAAVQSD